jgi:hypothetical protein
MTVQCVLVCYDSIVSVLFKMLAAEPSLCSYSTGTKQLALAWHEATGLLHGTY